MSNVEAETPRQQMVSYARLYDNGRRRRNPEIGRQVKEL